MRKCPMKMKHNNMGAFKLNLHAICNKEIWKVEGWKQFYAKYPTVMANKFRNNGFKSNTFGTRK